MYYFFLDFEDTERDIRQRFVLVDVPIGVSLQQAFNDFYDATRDRISDRTGAVILLRPTPKSQLSRAAIDAICKDEHVDTKGWRRWLKLLTDARKSRDVAFARFSDHSIHIVGSEAFAHFISGNINPNAPEDVIDSLGIDTVALLRQVQDAEIDHLIAEGHCRLPIFDNQYYRVPSGRLVRSFIRVGNIQRSRHALDAVFFWLLPHLTDCIGVITDTWSISSLSQNISRRLVEYRRDRSRPCPIEMLGDYADSAQQVRIAEIIGGFVDRLSLPNHSGSVLVLISATHTGSLQKSLDAYLTERGIADRVKYVSVLKLGAEAQVTALRDLSEESDFAPVVNPSQEEVERAIDIDRSVYFPVQAQDVEKVKTQALIEEIREFSGRYGGTPFARVHSTDDKTQSMQRHHMVWIDTAALIETDAFQTRLREKVRSLRPAPAVLVFPDHPAAHALAEKVRALLGGTPQLVCHEDLRIDANVPSDQAAKSVIAAVGKADAVLLLDDAFITGFRVSTYQLNLRRLNTQCVLHYLAAIARPEDRVVWDRQKNSFIKARGAREPNMQNTFGAVEHLILPNWSQDRCPWCVEAELADHVPESLRRASELVSTRDGLSDNLFLVRQGYQQPALQPDSYFGVAGMLPANLFCLVSSLLQRMRTDRVDRLPLLGEQHFLVSAVLCQETYCAFYTDPILVSSFLRAALPTELVYRDADKEKRRTERLNKVFRTDSSVLLGELLFSKLTNRLPYGSDINLDAVWAEAGVAAI